MKTLKMHLALVAILGLLGNVHAATPEKKEKEVSIAFAKAPEAETGLDLPDFGYNRYDANVHRIIQGNKVVENDAMSNGYRQLDEADQSFKINRDLEITEGHIPDPINLKIEEFIPSHNFDNKAKF